MALKIEENIFGLEVSIDDVATVEGVESEANLGCVKTPPLLVRTNQVSSEGAYVSCSFLSKT